MIPVVVAAAALLAAGADPGAPLAILGARVLREADLREHLADQGPGEADRAASDPSARREALEAYLDALALAARARQLGLDREARFRKARELAGLKLLAQLAAEHHRERLRGAPVREDELRRQHALQGDAVADGPRFTARHLLVYVEGNPAFPERGRPDAQARARAEEGLARLNGGEPWDAVARAWSDEPGTSERGGLVRDAELGRFPPEVQEAVRTQALGAPGPAFRSAFGYHVLQLEARAMHRTPRRFEEVRDALAERLAGQRAAEAREAFLGPVREEVGLRVLDAARRDAPLLDERAIPAGEPLAEVDGRALTEEDFRWFVRDALLPRQRADAARRPGARRALLDAFVDLHVLAAKARRDGLDRTEPFGRRLARAEERLLAEFAEAAEGLAAPGLCTAGGAERPGARRAYLDRVRAEVGLRPVAE